MDAPLPAIPEILNDPKLLQLILAKLQSETSRANLAEKHVAEISANRDEYKDLLNKATERGDTLEKANADRREESAALRMSVEFLRTSVAEYKSEVQDLRRDLSRARSGQKWWFAGGAAVGAGICTAIGRGMP